MCWTMVTAFLFVTATAAPDESPRFITPVIKSHGKVVQLPNAPAQPRDGAKICVDLTRGGPADKLNSAVEKLARYVNIYAGAGKSPAKAEFTVVLHGKATSVALNDSAYAQRFQTKRNPNLPMIRALRKAGVKFFVCGQTLALNGNKPSQVAAEVSVAVSALTVNVNRQQQGYAYIPLH